MTSFVTPLNNGRWLAGWNGATVIAQMFLCVDGRYRFLPQAGPRGSETALREFETQTDANNAAQREDAA